MASSLYWLRLLHDLLEPLAALGAIIQRLQSESNERGFTYTADHWPTMRNYCQLMARQLYDARAILGTFAGEESRHLRPEHLDFLDDVVGPALRTATLLRRAGLSCITVRGDFPRLHLDRFQLTRAVFDLIDDQLKYARNVTAPRLEIEARGVIGDRFEISFRDWGLAADEWRYEGASPSTVFARTLGAISSGRGSGLWFAERAISLHGGKLLLRSREDPTEFVIVLPIALVENPPNS